MEWCLIQLRSAQVHQSQGQPSQLYLLQGDTWHYPCGTLCHLQECVTTAFPSKRISSGSQEMKRCFLPDKLGLESDIRDTSVGRGRHSPGCVSQFPGQGGSSVASDCDPRLSLFLESLKHGSGLMWNRRNMDRWLPILTPCFILILFTGAQGKLKPGAVADRSSGCCFPALSAFCVLSVLVLGMASLMRHWPFPSSLSAVGFSLTAAGSQTLPGAWLGERQVANTALEILLLPWGLVAEWLQTSLCWCLRVMVSPACGWDLTDVWFKGFIFNRNVALDFESSSLWKTCLYFKMIFY